MEELECFLCGELVSEEDYCHGCGCYICGACDQNLGLMGEHDPEAHQWAEDGYDDSQ